jgi:hydroxyacylglutathione hydrolase
MIRLADGLFQLGGFPPNLINKYLIGDVLVDAGTTWARRRILRDLSGRTVSAHALTHAHPDHQGASHAVCFALGIPLWCGTLDADAVEDPTLIRARFPDGGYRWLTGLMQPGPAHPVARRLREGDDVAGFRVIDVPGHSRGHIAFWRESDRALVMGDVINNLNIVTGLPGLHEPPRLFTTDPVRNRESARKLAALEPALICFGHGPPLRDTKRFVEFVGRLQG